MGRGTIKKIRLPFFVLFLMLFGASAGLCAQQYAGVSVCYEPFPERTVEAGVAFPIIRNDMRTIFINRVTYQNTVYDFGEWDYSRGLVGSNTLCDGGG